MTETLVLGGGCFWCTEAVYVKVRGVIAIVDRMEGGTEAFAARGYWCKSLFTIKDFGIEPPKA